MIYAIPAIDIIDYRVVRLRQGDYDKMTTYDVSPFELGRSIADQGFSHLHIIDLEGARRGKNSLLPQIRKFAELGLTLQVGGGIRTTEEALSLVEAGASRVIVSTGALNNPEFFPALMKAIGAHRTVLSLDVRNGTVATHGWFKDTGLTPLECLKKLPGLLNLIVTDISRDGTLSTDVNTSLYASISEAFQAIHLIAAGGISSIESIVKLEEAGCDACIVGKSFYESEGLSKELVAHGYNGGIL